MCTIRVPEDILVGRRQQNSADGNLTLVYVDSC